MNPLKRAPNAAAAKPYAAILLDLFWTTVDLDFRHYPKVSVTEDGVRREIPSAAGILFELVSSQCLGLERQIFIESLLAAQRKVRKEWELGAIEEISNEKKFQDFLAALPGNPPFEPRRLRTLAAECTRLHMDRIIAATHLPPERKEFIVDLKRHHRLAIVSNFDHGPSGHRVLALHGVNELFDKVVISDDLGKRKPHPELFETALSALGVSPGEALMVGDTPLADVAGAARLGIETAWIQRPGERWPADLKPPDFTIESLMDLARLPRIRLPR